MSRRTHPAEGTRAMTHRIFTRDAIVMPRRPRDSRMRPSPAVRGRGFGPAGRLPEIDPVGGRAVSLDPYGPVEPGPDESWPAAGPVALQRNRSPRWRPEDRSPARSGDAAPAVRRRGRVAPRVIVGPATETHRVRGPPG